MKSKLYTLEELQEGNRGRSEQIGLSELAKVNSLVCGRTEHGYDVPYVGDMVQYTDEYGRHYPRAVIEKIRGGFAELMLQHSSYLDVGDSGDFWLSSSGGPGVSVPLSDLVSEKLLSPQRFWNFCGSAGAGRGVYFEVPVSTWSYVETRSCSQRLFESVEGKKVSAILEAVSVTQPEHAFDAFDILNEAFPWDRCFQFALAGTEKDAIGFLFNRYVFTFEDGKWTFEDVGFNPEKERNLDLPVRNRLDEQALSDKLRKLKTSQPVDNKEAFVELANLFGVDGCFWVSPMFERDKKHLNAEINGRVSVYCYCPEWSIHTNTTRG